MVALLVGLRWRQLGHQLARNPWMIVTLVVTGLMAVSMLALLTSGLVALRVFAPQVATTVLVAVGAVIVIGWWIGAIIVSSDEALAPERFALLPVSARRMLPGLVVAGATGVGGIGTSLALLLMLVGWSVSTPALIAGLVMAPVALLTCVLGARVVGGLLASWLARRRTRDIVVMAGTLLVMCSGLLLNLFISALTNVSVKASVFEDAADVMGWTPIAAAFGTPAAIVNGDWMVAGARLLIALATVVVLWLVSERLLAARLVAPIQSSGGGRVRSGGILDRVLPATPVGAIAARTLRYSRRDPRHLLNVLALVLLPAMMFGIVFMQGLRGDGLSFGAGLVLAPAVSALLVGTIAQMELAYDNDTLVAHILAGVRGTADRAGRLLGLGLLIVPVVLVLCVLCCLLVGEPALLPASIGATLGLSLAAAGIGAWIGVYMPGRAPAPEANPLGRGSSGGVQSMVAMLVIIPVTLILGGPALGFAIAAIVAGPVWGWFSLLACIVLGGAAVWAGTMLGGRALDRRWPEVLIAVTSES